MSEADIEKLIRDHSRKVHDTVYYMLKNPEDTEEVIQEVFFQAYRSLPGFKGDAAPSTWLYRIAMNVTIDFIRKQKRRPEVEAGMDVEEREEVLGLPVKSGTTEDEVLRRSKLNEIGSAVKKLPGKYRAVFLLNAVEGYTHVEIGEILGIKAGTVRVRFFRAVEMLRTELSA